jgi:Ca2+-binding EF-hand superfamily protein
MCDGGYLGVSCGGCKGGLTKESLAACQECPLTATRPTIMLVLGLICASGLATWIFHVSRLPPNALGITFSILLNYCQTLSIIGKFAIPFPLSLVVVFDFLQIFMIDLTAFNIPTDCAFGSTFLQRFAVELLLPFMLMLGCVGCYFAGKIYKALRVKCVGAESLNDLIPAVVSKHLSQKYLNMHLRHWWAMDKREILSTAIVIHNCFFIAFTSMCFKPLVWTLHPSDRYTLVSYPDVLTTMPEWNVSFYMAIPALFLYCVVYISIVIFAVLAAPKQVIINPSFRITFEELWDDSDPSCWWFCLVNLLYGLMLNMIPMVTTTARIQLIWSSVLFAGMIMLHMVYRPMKYELNNISNLVLSSATFFFIMCAQVTFDEDGRSDTVSYILMLILFVPALVIFGKTVHFAYNKKLYQVKAHADKAKFAYRLDDTLRLVIDRSAVEITSKVRKLEDSDLKKLELALDSLQYNFLSLQQKSMFRKRAHCLGPHGEVWPEFETENKGLLEHMVLAEGLTRPDDPRALARSFKQMIKKELAAVKGVRRSESKSSLSSRMQMAAGVSRFTFELVELLELSGQIDEEAFVSNVQQLSTCTFSDEQLSQLFKFIDTTGLGKITVIEIEAALQLDLEDLTKEGIDNSQPAAGQEAPASYEIGNINADDETADILISVEGEGEVAAPTNKGGMESDEESLEATI